MGRYSFKNNINPVVVVIDGVDTTLTASQQLQAADTVQVASNAEASQAYPSDTAAAQTTHEIN